MPLTPAGIEGLLRRRRSTGGPRSWCSATARAPRWSLSGPSGPDPLFSPVAELRMLSGPEATLWITDPATDVGNATSLAATALSTSATACSPTWSRASSSTSTSSGGPRRVQIRVTEVIPPHPPKLLAMAEQVVAYDEDLPAVDLILDAVDVRELVAANPAPHYLLPCRGSGMPAEGDVSFLDTPSALPRRLAAHRL